jgi:hypothetical protein
MLLTSSLIQCKDTITVHRITPGSIWISQPGYFQLQPWPWPWPESLAWPGLQNPGYLAWPHFRSSTWPVQPWPGPSPSLTWPGLAWPEPGPDQPGLAPDPTLAWPWLPTGPLSPSGPPPDLTRAPWCSQSGPSICPQVPGFRAKRTI